MECIPPTEQSPRTPLKRVVALQAAIGSATERMEKLGTLVSQKMARAFNAIHAGDGSSVRKQIKSILAYNGLSRENTDTLEQILADLDELDPPEPGTTPDE